MTGVTEIMRPGSTVNRGTLLKQLFVVSYLAGIIIATIGWLSAFGWIALRVAMWLLT